VTRYIENRELRENICIRIESLKYMYVIRNEFVTLITSRRGRRRKRRRKRRTKKRKRRSKRKRMRRRRAEEE
jgi:hypothetical protein